MIYVAMYIQHRIESNGINGKLEGKQRFALVHVHGRVYVALPEYKAKAVARGGSLGSEEPPQAKIGPPKGPLECTKRSTI